MRRRTIRAVALATLVGTVFQFGGCLGGRFWGQLGIGVAADQVSSYLDANGWGLAGLLTAADTTTG